MIAELRELTEKIHRADRFDEVVVTLFERMGISVAMVETNIAESRKRATWRDYHTNAALRLPRKGYARRNGRTSVMNSTDRGLPLTAIADVCRRYRLSELSLFGSTARGDAQPLSDLDLLVCFEPQAHVGFLTLARLARELSVLLNRKVDLVPKDGLNPRIRDQVLAEAEVLFAA